jgi:hypothetical protein
MSRRRALAAVPGGYDQVARRTAFEAAHPGARTWHDGSAWRAQWSLGGDPLRSRPGNDLRSTLNDLDDWAVMAAERRLMMREFPGWHVYVTGSGRWAAFPLGWPEVPPPLVTAAAAALLRAAIRVARESWRLPSVEGASR